MATSFYNRFINGASSMFPQPGKMLPPGGDKPPEEDMPKDPPDGNIPTAPGGFNDNVGGGNTMGTPNVPQPRIAVPGRTNIFGPNRDEAVNTRGNTNTDGFFSKPAFIGGGNVIGPGGGQIGAAGAGKVPTGPGGVTAPGAGKQVYDNTGAGGVAAPAAARVGIDGTNASGMTAPGAAANSLAANASQVAPNTEWSEALNSLLTPGVLNTQVRNAAPQSKYGGGGAGAGVTQNPGPAAIANSQR